MERILHFGIPLLLLIWAYCKGRHEAKKEEWTRMQEVAQSLHIIADRCEKQALDGKPTDRSEEWGAGAMWVLGKWKEGIW